MFHLYGVPIQVSKQLSGVEDFLHIIFLAVQLHIADTVDSQGVAVAADQLYDLLQKCLRVVEEIPAPSALHQNPVDGGRGQQRFIADGGNNVRQGLIVVGNIHCPHFPFYVTDSSLFNMDAGGLGHQSGFGDMGHFPDSFDAVLHKLLGVNAHPISGFLLDLVP